MLWQPCHDFVTSVRSDQAFEHEGKDAAPVFGVRPSTTLEYAMRKMYVVVYWCFVLICGGSKSYKSDCGLSDQVESLCACAM